MVSHVPLAVTPSVHASIPDPVTLMTTGRPLAKLYRTSVGASVEGDSDVGDIVGVLVGINVAVGIPVGLRLDGVAVVE